MQPTAPHHNCVSIRIGGYLGRHLWHRRSAGVMVLPVWHRLLAGVIAQPELALRTSSQDFFMVFLHPFAFFVKLTHGRWLDENATGQLLWDRFSTGSMWVSALNQRPRCANTWCENPFSHPQSPRSVPRTIRPLAHGEGGSSAIYWETQCGSVAFGGGSGDFSFLIPLGKKEERT